MTFYKNVLPFVSCPQADEYVVYSPHQQRMRYLVEFSLPDEDGLATDETSEISETGEARVTTEPTDGEESMEAINSEGICRHISVTLQTEYKK